MRDDASANQIVTAHLFRIDRNREIGARVFLIWQLHCKAASSGHGAAHNVPSDVQACPVGIPVAGQTSPLVAQAETAFGIVSKSRNRISPLRFKTIKLAGVQIPAGQA